MGTPAEQLLRINSRADLISATSKHSSLTSYHILLLCPFREVEDLITNLGEDTSIYSVLSMEDSPELLATANKIDTVPFFYVKSEIEAKELVRRLIMHPNDVVHKALNGTEVALRYTEGSPS